MPVPTARTLAALVLVACAAAGGCAGTDRPTPEERVDAEQTLRSRPTLEDTVARYEQMQQTIRARLDAAIGPFPWNRRREGSEGTCGRDFPVTFGGRNLALPPWGFDGAIPDRHWARAAGIVADTAAEYGFATAGLQIDQPGYHQLNGVDTTLGAHYSLGTEINTSMQVTTGCHLPASAG